MLGQSSPCSPLCDRKEEDRASPLRTPPLGLIRVSGQGDAQHTSLPRASSRGLDLSTARKQKKPQEDLYMAKKTDISCSAFTFSLYLT